MVTFWSVQCHPGVTYILNFLHLGTLALSPERQSAQMSEIKNVRNTWMAKCNQLTSLPFKGLIISEHWSIAPTSHMATLHHKICCNRLQQSNCWWSLWQLFQARLSLFVAGNPCGRWKKSYCRSLSSVESKEMESFSFRCYAAHCIWCCC